MLNRVDCEYHHPDHFFILTLVNRASNCKLSMSSDSSQVQILRIDLIKIQQLKMDAIQGPGKLDYDFHHLGHFEIPTLNDRVSNFKTLHFV